MANIKLLKSDSNIEFIVDEDIFELLKCKKIRASKRGKNVYGVVSPNTLLHRFIMDAKTGDVVDHINRNTLDNRRCNLRIVDHSINNKNRAGYGRISYKYMSLNYRHNRPNNAYEVKFPNMRHRSFININEAKAYYIECLFALNGGLI